MLCRNLSGTVVLIWIWENTPDIPGFKFVSLLAIKVLIITWLKKHV